jgi:hypothetical protein
MDKSSSGRRPTGTKLPLPTCFRDKSSFVAGERTLVTFDVHSTFKVISDGQSGR